MMAGHIINEGDRFGKLVVIAEAESRIDSKTGYKKDKMYLCRCDCGNEITVRATRLAQGQTENCGCLTKSARNKERQDFSPTPASYGCIYCGSDDYYSGGMCRNCCFKSMRGSLSREIESMIPMY